MFNSNYIFMNKKEKNEGLQSRREFFKKAAKGALPILGAIVLAQLPVLSNAAQKNVEAECYCLGCVGGCLGECLYSCLKSCYNTCKGACYGTCKDTCNYGCYNSCYNSCYTSCYKMAY